MNGVLELTDPGGIRRSHGNDDTNELMNIPEEEAWDEGSYSDSGSDCSCSTCSTCSLCDHEEGGDERDLYPLQDAKEGGPNRIVYQNRGYIQNGGTQTFSGHTESLGSHSSTSGCQTRNHRDTITNHRDTITNHRDTITCEVQNEDVYINGVYAGQRPKQRNLQTSVINQSNLNNFNGVESTRFANNKQAIFRIDCYSSDESSHRNGTRNNLGNLNRDQRSYGIVKPPLYIAADSSGSEREALYSGSGRCNGDRADSSSELSSSGYSEGGGKEKRKKKKVTFMETSLGVATEAPFAINSGHLLNHRVEHSTNTASGSVSLVRRNEDIISNNHIRLANESERRSSVGSSDISPSGSVCNGDGLPVLKQPCVNGLQRDGNLCVNGINGTDRNVVSKKESRAANREHRRIRLHQTNDSKKPNSNSNTEQENDVNTEYIRLRHVLNHIDPYKLHSVLRHQLKRKNSGVVAALGTLLPRETYTAGTIHCVRCHKEYNPKYGKTHCELPHPPGAIVRLSQVGDEASFRCTVCGHEFSLIGCWDDEMNIEKHSGHCFVGVHTPRSDEVLYVPSGPAMSCEERGCIEFYV